MQKHLKGVIGPCHALIQNAISTKTFCKNESNVGLTSQKGWEQGRVVGTVRGMLTIKKYENKVGL